MNCDICGKTITSSDSVCIPIKDIQRAVLDGFNPFNTPAMDIVSNFMTLQQFDIWFDIEYWFMGWRYSVLTDKSNWTLCNRCSEAMCLSTKLYPIYQPKSIITKEEFDTLLNSFTRDFKNSKSSIASLMAIERDISFYYDSYDKFFLLGILNLVVSSHEKNKFYFNRTIEFLKKALVHKPNDVTAFSRLFDLYVSKEDYYLARITAIDWAKIDTEYPDKIKYFLISDSILSIPEDIENVISKGIGLQKKGDSIIETTEYFKKAKLIYPTNSDIDILLSSALSDRGAMLSSKNDLKMYKPESAFLDFIFATKLNPNNWKAFVNLCTAAHNRGDFELSLTAGKKALELNTELKSNQEFIEQLKKTESFTNYN